MKRIPKSGDQKILLFIEEYLHSPDSILKRKCGKCLLKMSIYFHLCFFIGRLVFANAQRSHVEINPRWPGKPYKLVCPNGTNQAECQQLARQSPMSLETCFEPESDTENTLNSFLLHCGDVRSNCLYIDIGCNIGYFAMQAAALGANVECFEPTTVFSQAIEESVKLNEFRMSQVKVVNAAVMPKDSEDGKGLSFSKAYTPCGIGVSAISQAEEWNGKITCQNTPYSCVFPQKLIHGFVLPEKSPGSGD